MTSLRRLFAVVLWHAGFAPCERIERHAAITYLGRPARAANEAPATLATSGRVTHRSGDSHVHQ